MDPVGSSASGSASGSAGMGTCSGTKKKVRVESVYAHEPDDSGVVVDLSAGPLPVNMLHSSVDDRKKSWGSEMNSEESSVGRTSDIENIKDMIVEETSYVDSDTSGDDELMGNATPKGLRTRTYVFEHLPKQPFFIDVGGAGDVLKLPLRTFNGSNQLLPVASHDREIRSFISVKSFALDIKLFAVPGKTVRIIRSSFTSEKSLIKARKMAISEKILVNDDLRKVNSHSDWKVIVKEIPVDLPKSVIETVFSKFGKIISIKVQLIGLWQKALVEYESSEVADLVTAKWSVLMGKDSVRVAKASALFYTFPVGTTAHDLSALVEAYSEKTCFIGRNPFSYVRNQCAVICFESEASKLAAIDSVPVFKGVGLCWAGLSLASCAHCKLFGHTAVDCSVGRRSGGRGKRAATSQDRVWLANIYRKKQAPIVRPVSFGGKTWAQVVGSSLSHVVSSGAPGVGLISGSKAFSMDSSLSGAADLGGCLAVLECSVEILSDQVLLILKKLSFVDLVLLAPSHSALPLIWTLGLALDSTLLSSASSPSNVGESIIDFSPSSSKVLTAKIGSLESNMVALEASGINVPAKQADDKFDGMQIFSSGLDKGFMGAGVAIVMNISLVHHVSKMEEIPGRVISVRLLFKGKLSVTVLGLYAGVSSGARFGQTSEVNSLIAKTVNSSNFVILDGDFNENGSGRSASFKFCLSLGLVNLFIGHYLANSYTWSNSRGVKKTIDYIFVGSNLSSVVAGHQVVSVSDFFNTDHKAVVVSVGLSGLLDVQLNSLRKQVNKDHWKFKIKNADCVGWAKFKDFSLAKLLSLGEVFSGAEIHGNVDAMWAVLVGAVVDSADVTFSRHWFSEFKCLRNKHSSRFFGLELLVAKIVKKFCSGDLLGANCLVSKWSTLDDAKTCAFKDLVGSGVKSDVVVRHLSLVRRDYRRSKMFESRLAEEASVRKAIEKRMDNFCSDKGSMIKSVLEKPFRKVVLDHLIVDDDLVLLSKEMKSSMDKIMEGWTRKRSVQSVLPGLWACQYAPLDHVWNDAFSGVMSARAAGLSGVPNELWKHGGEVVLGCLLALFNKCLSVGVVFVLWKRAWDRVFTNTWPIALIETARKILSKILSDCISMACSKFNVLQGDNFSVLKDMWKAYDLVGWHYLRASLRHVKMCERFIRFFGGIHEDRVNRVITDFGLSGGYKVHDGLDQGEVFLPLLWRIFYNSLLCKVKRHKQLCEYQINTKFVSKSGRIKSGGGLTLYFSAGAFVDDTIWVGNCQASTQYALNIASEFFVINDISINSEKMSVKVALLNICGQPISIAKKRKTHWYLDIFLLTEGLSKPSVAKAYADVHFFVNVVLRKAITDKQFSYLVSAVLQPIVSYCIQFSFVSSNVCRKWDVLVRKGLRSKACLPHDFPDTALHHPSLYGLKSFEQMQSEGKVAALMAFSNAFGILGHLFRHRFLDLQVLGWAPLDPLQFPVRLHVSPVNNFLAGMVKIFLGNELALVNNLPTAFRSPGQFPLSFVLRKSLYFDSVKSLKCFGVTFGNQLFDKKGVLLDWKTFRH
ncbi:hypothetical protein G9A89_020559 [Geosiphon pyriformis]|nr:hypothetical protein G9A89_020559 [Geosiphon pyriformis]